MKIAAADNVAVALTDLKAGEQVEVAGNTYELTSAISAKHKFALQDLRVRDSVIMYGVVVGEVVSPIRLGEALTTSNLRHHASGFQVKSSTYKWNAPDVSKWRDRNFAGYRRSDGQVGTRNYWLVVPLVFCENRNILALQQAFEKELGNASPQTYTRHVSELVRLYREGKSNEIETYPFSRDGIAEQGSRVFRNVDGVKFLTHEMGCGGTRQDAQALCGLIAGYIHHPNVAGATILSLGCQHAQSTILQEEIHKRNPKFDKPLFIFDQQQSNLESAMMEGAIRKTFQGLVKANELERTPAPLSALSVGLKCGGSDGFSGISANPAIGHLADIISVLGGKGILAEFPELCGVEQNLIDRCAAICVGRAPGQFDAYIRRSCRGGGFWFRDEPVARKH